MKKTLKQRLALEPDTVRVLTEPPGPKPQYQTIAPQKTFPASSQVPTCPAGSTGPCTCQ